MPPPTRPTPPAQPLRSNPDSFSARAEAAIQYQWTDFPAWLEAVGIYAEQQAGAAASAAAAAGAAEGFDLAGKANYFLRVNSAETATEFSSPSDSLTALGGTLTGLGLFTATTALSARTTLGATTVGNAIFTAVDAAAARAAMGSQASLGFTPVQQGGGAGQLTNKIYLGWNGSRIGVQVDSSNLGSLALLSDIPASVDVMGTLASQVIGAVGTYAMARPVVNGVTVASGATRAGGDLTYSNAAGSSGGSLPGTWRNMGGSVSGGAFDNISPSQVTLWLRIA